MHTDEENKTISGGFDTGGTFNGNELHARNDWTDKVNVEDGVDVHDVEDERDGKEAGARKDGHGEEGGGTVESAEVVPLVVSPSHSER